DSGHYIRRRLPCGPIDYYIGGAYAYLIILCGCRPGSTCLVKAMATILTHLQRLQFGSIQIIPQGVGAVQKPVMLYFVGKDSACMLHLARKAFYPSPPPFPLLHVDTTWKFKAMYELRDRMARESGMELLVYQNPEAKERGINPFDHGSALHTDMWKTE